MSLSRAICVLLGSMALVPRVATSSSSKCTPDWNHNTQQMSNEQNQITPRCCNPVDNIHSSNLVVVSTIDGKLIALDGRDGKTIWEINGDPLLSSTLSSVESLTMNGVPIGFLPSLDGDLYVYVPEIHVLEPIAVNTDYLLDATLKLGQDAVAGGRTVSTMGVDIATGKIRYSCTFDKCSSDNTSTSNATLVIKRVTKSVRAMDARTGAERWNLSVSELDLSVVSMSEYAADFFHNGERFLLRPPDGKITAINEFDDEVWTRSLDNHITRVWHLKHGALREISLFDSENLYSTFYRSRARTELIPAESLFYIGTRSGEPFIIQSPKLRASNQKRARSFTGMDVFSHLASPRLYETKAGPSNQIIRAPEVYQIGQDSINKILDSLFRNTHVSRMQITDGSSTALRTTGELRIVTHVDESETNGAACPNTQGVKILSIRNAAPMNAENGDSGWLVMAPSTEDPTQIPAYPQINTPVRDGFIGSFQTFACQVLALASAAVATVYVALRNRINALDDAPEEKATEDSGEVKAVALYRSEEFMPVELIRPENFFLELRLPMVSNASGYDEYHSASNLTPIKVVTPKATKRVTHSTSSTEESIAPVTVSRRSRNASRNSNSDPFQSKFLSEYTPTKILGHGGFGIVFKAKNNLDNNEYAVKRIAVIDSERSITKVRREVCALALLDHSGIIRYFHTWMERPPDGWQKKADEELLPAIDPNKIRSLRQNGLISASCDSGEVSEEKSSEKLSLNKSFEMPPVVEGKEDNSWSEDSSKGTEEDSSSDDSSDSSGPARNNYKIPKSETDSDGIVFEKSASSVPQKVADKRVQFNRENPVNPIKTEVILGTSASGSLHPVGPGKHVYMYIQMQLCEERTLHEWLLKNKTVAQRPLAKMRDWMHQLAQALAYLHSKGYIHRDLKVIFLLGTTNPKNVFFALDRTVDGGERLKIGDLGLVTDAPSNGEGNRESFDGNSNLTGNVGTRGYMSPEQLASKPYTEKVDVFSYGLICCELVVPFATHMERINTLVQFQEGKPVNVLNKIPEAKDFILWLTKSDPDRRPSFQEVLASKFFK
ncbi:unnamed protein product [Caenorhabditis auriculariae]|uniref:PRKR-like endoplasmic reticulum kinase n=1 Tax=Caenorhabditis auriculariae TaxID=2777116 RepID=A0A8S1H7N1_9PELO|nr:unnamed protein product [Caenorhabditis auriculariae]